MLILALQLVMQSDLLHGRYKLVPRSYCVPGPGSHGQLRMLLEQQTQQIILQYPMKRVGGDRIVYMRC